jgi:tripartite-type tricarboxylate transporter receptor subunit TctC
MMGLRQSARARRFAAALAALAAVGLTAGCSGVQNGAVGGGDATGGAADYPTGPIEFQVGASAGGSTDLLARALAASLEGPLDETVNVVNQPGANGAVAAQYVMGRPADGQTAMLVSGSLITITPLFVSEAEAISLDDIQVVTGIGREDYVLVAHKDSGFTSIDDLTAAGRNINYATAGVGTGGQLSQLLLFDQLGIESTDVPFDGGAPAVTALLGNQVDVAAVQVLEAAQHIESGAFVPLATFGEERSSFLEDVPTATEEGYDVVVTQSRFAMVAKDTPADIVDVLAASFQEAFDDPEYQDFIEQNFIEPDETDAEETVANLEEAKDRYLAAAQDAGVVD